VTIETIETIGAIVAIVAIVAINANYILLISTIVYSLLIYPPQKNNFNMEEKINALKNKIFKR
jgi:hypothetical protein